MIFQATSEIGENFSIYCAENGINIIGVDNDLEKLNQLMLKCTKLGIEFLPIYESILDHNSIDNITSKIMEIDVKILILCDFNDISNDFYNLNENKIKSYLNSNITLYTLLIKEFSSKIKENGSITFLTKISNSDIFLNSINSFLKILIKHLQVEHYSKNISYQIINFSTIKNLNKIIFNLLNTNSEFDYGFKVIYYRFIRWLFPDSTLEFIYNKIFKHRIENKKID